MKTQPADWGKGNDRLTTKWWSPDHTKRITAVGENLIFGHTWEEIKKTQQKQGSLHKPITPQGKPQATEVDVVLLQKHGIAGLLEMGFHGVIDRLRTSNLV